MLAAECDIAPTVGPPHAWCSTLFWITTLLLPSSLPFHPKMSSLPWWFTKGHCSTPATEPHILPSPRPPPAWGSCLPQLRIQHSALLVLLLMAPPTSALSTQESADISWLFPAQSCWCLCLCCCCRGPCSTFSRTFAHAGVPVICYFESLCGALVVPMLECTLV